MISNKYTEEKVEISQEGQYTIKKEKIELSVIKKTSKRLGVMIVGWGGNNGSTLTAGLIAKKQNLKWRNKNGEHRVEFLGSISQFGSVHIGYDINGKPHSKLFKELEDMYSPDELVISGWDICGDDLYTAVQKACVIDYELLNQMKNTLSKLKPLKSIYDPNFIANNQNTRVNNIISNTNKLLQLNIITNDIIKFKKNNNLDDVIILWSASTECFHKGKWNNYKELINAIGDNDPKIPPSVLFAFAAAQCGCTFLNGSPQNTICSAIIDTAKHFGTFVGGEDFKTGQTKLKSALVEWLAASGIRPLSIVSYNHLGNNDGKNLDEEPQFKSKEITKKNVIDDIVEENPKLLPDGNPDHAVVIKYIPAVRDSKRAMDEYYSQLFLDGHHTLSIHNICEDSLLAAPLMLDLILFSELFSRVRIKKNNEDPRKMKTVLSLLSLFFKAPVVNKGEPTINAFFKQRYALDNFFRVLKGLPPLNYINLNSRI